MVLFERVKRKEKNIAILNKIKAYIKVTGVKTTAEYPYTAAQEEFEAVSALLTGTELLRFVFEYGRAKGWNASQMQKPLFRDARTQDDEVLSDMIRLEQELGRRPTVGEMVNLLAEDPTFPRKSSTKTLYNKEISGDVQV